jgi:site-specific DNA recombinase
MAEKTRGIKIEQGAKRVRVYLAGELVADTKTPFLVWEWPHYPTYYIPMDDVRAELVPAGRTEHSPSRGEGQVYHVKVAGADADGAALCYPDSPIEALRDLVRLDWNSMTEWFEEDEPVYAATIPSATLRSAVPARTLLRHLATVRQANLAGIAQREKAATMATAGMGLLGEVRLSNLTDASTSDERQTAQIKGYSDLHGHRIVYIARDLDISGSVSPFDRPDLGPWLTEPDKINAWDGIIVAKLDRLTRSLRHFDDFREWCDKHGKTIISVEESIDLSTPLGRMFANLLAMFAEFQRTTTMELRSDAADVIRKAGRWGGGVVPFGREAYKDPDSKFWYLRICNGDCAHGLNLLAELGRIADAIIDGVPAEQVAQDLNRRGVPTSSDAHRIHAGKRPQGKKWKGDNLAKILRSENLLGYVLHYRRGETPKRVYVDGAPVKIEPLLDRVTWDKIQAALVARSTPWQRDSVRSSVILGVGFCLYCGASLRKNPVKRHKGLEGYNYYYQCANMRDRQACPHSLQIPMAALDKAVDDAIMSYGHLPHKSVIVTPGRNYQVRIDEIEGSLRELDFDSPDFADKQAALLAERKRLIALPAESATVSYRADGRTVGEVWQALDERSKRQFLAKRGIKIYAKREKGAAEPEIVIDGGELQADMDALQALETA